MQESRSNSSYGSPRPAFEIFEDRLTNSSLYEHGGTSTTPSRHFVKESPVNTNYQYGNSFAIPYTGHTKESFSNPTYVYSSPSGIAGDYQTQFRQKFPNCNYMFSRPLLKQHKQSTTSAGLFRFGSKPSNAKWVPIPVNRPNLASKTKGEKIYPMRNGLPPGFGGFIPGAQFQHGKTFGNSTRNCKQWLK